MIDYERLGLTDRIFLLSLQQEGNLSHQIGIQNTIFDLWWFPTRLPTTLASATSGCERLGPTEQRAVADLYPSGIVRYNGA
jgi:hypothetical protein